ncbi:MAG: glutathione S-transferase N-terminal domain-containing protein [Maricaulaceae bacterium]
MSEMILHIGNYNYSSWSLRPWLVLKKSELPFRVSVTDLDVPGYKDKLNALSSAGTVPVLEVNGEMIPDSLAICEFAAKCVPNLWPKNEAQKQRAREVTQAMHEGFQAIREHAPMNLRRRTSHKMPKACLDDAALVDALWQDLLADHDGAFLFKDWSIADAFYAPVATRFESYALPRTARSDTYISELMSDPDFQDWEAMAFAEGHILPETDAVNR